MKKKLISLLFLAPISICAQTIIKPFDITIDFDRAIHVVLSKTVEYVADGSNVIESTKVDEAPNIVRIVAMEENFVGTTNVTIISKGGEIFTYNIRYDNTGNEYTFFPEAHKEVAPYSIYINHMNAGHIVFPNDVKYYKQGNEQKFVITKASAPNILKIEPYSANQLSTVDKSNLFVVDIDGNDYSIDVRVGESSSYIYNIGDKGVANVALNEENIESLAHKVLNIKRGITTQGFKKNKFEFSLDNIFVQGEQLFFVLGLKNSSNIDLDIDFVKCFMIDEKTLKNEVRQDPEIEYKQQYNFKDKIEAKTDHTFVLVFDKFTIPDKKVFKIEIYEKGGGRHINFNIKNNVIIGAKKIG